MYILLLLITAEKIHNLQEVRKQRLKENCKYDKEAMSEGKHSFEDISDSELNNLIVDDKHGIIYCYIPKVTLAWTHSTHDCLETYFIA